MKRSVILMLVSLLLAGAAAAPAQANDKRIEFVLGLTFAKADYIAKRVTDSKSSYKKFGGRLIALAQREARVMTHVQPSSKAGAVARHQTIQGLKQLRISGRYWVLATEAKSRRAAARFAFRATVKMNRGLFRLVVAARALTG
jgi:hypothetical protein